MPLRMLIDGEAVLSSDVALVGSRNLDPPERRYIDEVGLWLDEEGLDGALEGVDAAYVAFDVDAIDPAETIAAFMPEPGGPSLADAEALLRRIAAAKPIAGVGFTGLLADRRNVGRARAALRGALGLLGPVIAPARTAHADPAPYHAAVPVPRRIVSRMAGRVDVSIEHRDGPESDGGQAANTCPACNSHYRDDELEQTLWVCAHCGNHFRVRARDRIAQLADSANLRRRRRRHPLGRSARVLRPAPVQGAAGEGGDRHAARRRHRHGPGEDRAAGLPARRHGLRLHGWFDG